MATRGRLKRSKGAIVVLSGIVSAVVIVGVALAVVLIQITASVSSNEFIPPTTTTTTTTTTIPAPTNGLQVALGTGGAAGACGSFGTGSLALNSINFDLNGSGGSTGQFLCVKNNGGSGIPALSLQIAANASGEAGCSAAEGAVDPEGVTCGTAGELTTLLQFTLTKTADTGFGDCSANASVALSGSSSSLLSGSALSPGAICVWSITTGFDGSPTDDQKLAASTDTAGFTFDVTASP